MNLLANIAHISLITLIIAGCSSLPLQNNRELCANDQGEFYPCENIRPPEVGTSTIRPPYSAAKVELINDYVEQMVAEFETNISRNNHRVTRPITVTAFKYPDQPESKSTALSQLIEEAFIRQLRKIGFVVSDEIKPNHKSVKTAYRVEGVIKPVAPGVVIHASLIATKSHRVMASSNRLLPNAVLIGF